MSQSSNDAGPSGMVCDAVVSTAAPSSPVTTSTRLRRSRALPDTLPDTGRTIKAGVNRS